MLNSQPLLSVVIPVYNRPEKVLQAISSALNAIECAQKTKQFSAEILVIDDGSDIPIELGKLGNQYTSCSVELRVIRSDQNGGVGKARNLGIANAFGRYLSFLDSDDIYLANRFCADLEFMTQYTVEFCYGTTQDVRASNLDWNAPCREDSLTRFTAPTPMLGKMHAEGRHGHMHLNAVTIQKNAIEQEGIVFARLKRSEDTVFIHECLDNLYSLPNPETRPIAKRFYHESNSLKFNRKGTPAFLWSSLKSKANFRTKIAVIWDVIIQNPKNVLAQWLRS